MRASHTQPGFLAALLHRLAGIALAIFLPLHFWALSGALNGADFLDKFLKVTEQPLVKFAEGGIVAPGMWDAGIYCRADDRGNAVVQFAPPLICGHAEFDEIESATRSVLSDAWAQL